MEYCVYVLFSDSHQRTYTGLTNNVERRLAEHNKGQCSSTKHYKPWRLMYVELCPDLKSARALEKKYKSGYGREKIKKIITAQTAGN